jgi:hypothetical protein
MKTFLIICLLSSLPLFGQAKTPCKEPEQKQLDFWVGEWTLTWPGQNGSAEGHGTNSIKRILDGCVVEETFSGEDSIHLRGHSVSIFDATDNKWKQTWVDNEGGYLDFTGGMQDGQMSFWRNVTRTDGAKSISRMVWRNVTRDSFDWSWESSKDGGKTWQVMWPIHYQRKK